MPAGSNSQLQRSIWLGAASGIHVTAGPAAASWAAMTGDLPLDDTPFSLLGQPDLTALLFASAGLEIIADKLPFLPPRTSAGPLAGRVVIGAGIGIAVAMGNRQSRAWGAVLGGCAAAVSAFAATTVRRIAAERGLPEPLWGLVDSVLAVTLARRGIRPSA